MDRFIEYLAIKCEKYREIPFRLMRWIVAFQNKKFAYIQIIIIIIL